MFRATDRSGKRKSGGRRSRAGGLTLLILAVNIVPLLVLVVGLLSLGQYRQNLINESLKLLRERTQNMATAVAEGAVRPVQKGRPFLFAKPEEIEVMIPELARRMVRRLAESDERGEIRIRLFGLDGALIADSHQFSGPGGIVQVVPASPAPGKEKLSLSGMLAYAGTELLDMLPIKTDLPPWHETRERTADSYPDAAKTIATKKISGTAWQNDDDVILTAAAPVRKMSQDMGVILLTSTGRDVEEGMARVRFDVLTAAIAALSLTFFLSLYLAGVIGRPLKKLANAAEAVRLSTGRTAAIPDFGRRRDEIGDLSVALREMTQALRDRMDTIERFAADVAHEIKNPLTSLRSAVETAARIKDPGDRDRLMQIVLHDVQRLDRLISDISNASRLDAELSREAMGAVNLSALLRHLAASHLAPLERAGTETEAGGAEESARILLDLPGDDLHISGSESRLAQVFENLIVNALSFSPPAGIVAVKAARDGEWVRIDVSDNGPGIPENKLEAIFERFYSERPKHEDYGSHSGLGLSIARQIVTAHNGTIAADNLRGPDGRISGARFTVLLPAGGTT